MNLRAFGQGFAEGMALPALACIAAYAVLRRAFKGDDFSLLRIEVKSLCRTEAERKEAERQAIAWIDAECERNNALYEYDAQFGSRH